jgi:hypothetical protein
MNLRLRGGGLLLSYLVFAVILRCITFGDPVLHIDEQFYLLVGDRMLHGSIPYVDIWDRKPIGLFILYAAMRALGGDGVIQYQLVALGFAVATALTINRLARKIASPEAAWWTGLLYLPYLSLFGCFGGQSPVFYNLPVALAALLMCRVVEKQRLLVDGLLAMLLIGIAIQIKYTVVFEGAAFGIALLYLGWKAGWSVARICLTGLLWCGVALSPTILAVAVYEWIGHGPAFIQANFLSFFGRHQDQLPALMRLGKEALLLTPLGMAIYFDQSPSSPVKTFLRYWAGAAVAGFLIFGTYLDHYTAPLLVPLTVIAAPGLGWQVGRKVVTALAVLVSGIGAFANTLDQHYLFGNRNEVASATSAIRLHLAGGCFYMFEGDDPILYETTNSCLVSRFVFPQHLASTMEAGALGVSQVAEERKVLARRPTVIMTGGDGMRLENPAVVAVISAELRRDYVQYDTVKIGRRSYRLFERKDNLRPQLLAGQD